MTEHENVTDPRPDSYWDALPEKELEGKTLSTLNLSQLEHERIKEESSALSSMTPDPIQKQGGSYWVWQETIRKSLSKMTLTELFFQSSQPSSNMEDIKKTTVPEQKVTPSDQAMLQTDSTPSYWFWRNASFGNLRMSAVSLPSLEAASRQDDGQNNIKPSQGTGYWFWRNASMANMSTASLDSMDRHSQEADHPTKEWKDVNSLTSASSTRGTVRPISTFSHRLRNSWRKSFQQLSSNSLSRLSEDDAAESQAGSWKQAFGASRKASETEFVREERDGTDMGVSSRSSDGAIEF